MKPAKDKLGPNSYGKSGIRMVKVSRDPKSGKHDMREIEVAIALEGDFEAIHCKGDNSLCLPTDTMKNTVYALGKDHPLDSIESFALHLARHFVGGGEHKQVSAARIQISETPWKRVHVEGAKHPHCFLGCSNERPACEASAQRAGAKTSESIRSGFEGMMLLKTTDSAFSGYPKTRFTTLKETRDRIFATSLTAWWDYEAVPKKLDFDSTRHAISEAMIRTFATHKSESVQQTLFEMGKAALAASPAPSRIHLSMPNKHRILVDLSPFGLTNQNEIFVPTEEPYGLIEATIERG